MLLAGIAKIIILVPVDPGVYKFAGIWRNGHRQGVGCQFGDAGRLAGIVSIANAFTSAGICQVIKRHLGDPFIGIVLAKYAQHVELNNPLQGQVPKVFVVDSEIYPGSN